MKGFITRRGGSSQQGFFPSLFVTGLDETDGCTATCNGKSFNGVWAEREIESEEKALIPIMTSNTTPSGEAFASNTYSSTTNLAYMAFNNDQSTHWSTQKDKGNGSYIGYTFTKPVCVKQIYHRKKTNIVTGTTYECKLQASNDLTNWQDIGTTFSIGDESTTTINNKQSYLSYRLYIVSSSDGWGTADTLQFYGTEAPTTAQGFYFPKLTELGMYTLTATSGSDEYTDEILIDAPIEYQYEFSKIPRNGLVAEYLFDGDTEDTSGNDNDLTNNGVTFGNNVGVFNGSSYAVANSGVIPTNSPISISFWIKRGSVSQGLPVLSTAWSYTHYGLYIEARSDGKIRFVICQGTNNDPALMLETSNLADNLWHYITFTWSGDIATNGAKVYVDGELIISGTSKGALTSHTYKFFIGGTGYSTTYIFTGSLDQIRIYNRVLEMTEIEALYGEKVLYKTKFTSNEEDWEWLNTNGNRPEFTSDGWHTPYNLKGNYVFATSSTSRLLGFRKYIEYTGNFTVDVEIKVNSTQSNSALGGFGLMIHDSNQQLKTEAYLHDSWAGSTNVRIGGYVVGASSDYATTTAGTTYQNTKVKLSLAYSDGTVQLSVNGTVLGSASVKIDTSQGFYIVIGSRSEDNNSYPGAEVYIYNLTVYQ